MHNYAEFSCVSSSTTKGETLIDCPHTHTCDSETTELLDHHKQQNTQQYSYKNSVTLPISCFFGLSASPAVVNPSLKTPKEQEQSVSVPRSPSNMKNLEYFESKVHIKNQYVTSNRFLKFSQIHWSITCKFAWKQMLRVRDKFLNHMFQNKTTPSVNCSQCHLMCQIFQGIFKA